MSLYRGFSPEQLDAQYRARATVSEAEFLNDMARYSQDTLKSRQNTKHQLKIPYGESVDEYLDLYLSETMNAPVFIYIHGGYWRMLSADESGFMAENFTKLGIHVAVINYGLAPKTNLKDIVSQNQRAMQWLYSHIGQYGGDGERLYVAGSSAGGHLAALMAHEKGVVGACLLSGIFDLTPISQIFTQEWLQLQPFDIAPLSPWVNPPPAHLPLIFSYGVNETDEFKRQSNDFMRLCAARGSEASFVNVPHSTHFNIVFALQQPHSILTKEIMAVLKR